MKSYRTAKNSHFILKTSMSKLVVRLILSATQLPVTRTLAEQMLAMIDPALLPTARTRNLVFLRILVIAKFAETRQFVTYSFLIRETGLHPLVILSLLAQAANEDIANDDPTVDSLVANDGDTTPPEGSVKATITNRFKLKSMNEREKYHSEMMRRYREILDTKRSESHISVEMTKHGKTRRLVPIGFQHAGIPLTFSGARVSQPVVR